MAAPIKIIAVGAVAGTFSDFFMKIKSINSKHGKFDMVLCIGDFFGSPTGREDKNKDLIDLLAGNLEVPVHCYIMQGEFRLPETVVAKVAKTEGEVCNNVFLLNNSAVINTPSGIRLACLGGIYDLDFYSSAPGYSSPYFGSDNLGRLITNTTTKSDSRDNKRLPPSTSPVSQLVDILVTNVWPEAIHPISRLANVDLVNIHSPALDDVIRRIKPRYHFASGAGTPRQFWEREPYIWDKEDGRIARFISLGAFGCEQPSGKKPRWFYAFSLSPDPISTTLPINLTKNPFLEPSQRSTKHSLDDMTEDDLGFGPSTGRKPHLTKRFKVCDPYQPSASNVMVVGEEKKPPPGYKCHRCESEQHFIFNCPKRVQPSEGYVCRICNASGHFVGNCPARHSIGYTVGCKPKAGYVCRACGSKDHYLDDCPLTKHRMLADDRRRKGNRSPRLGIRPEDCWFCLGNPCVAKHLVVSIGSECYLTLPRGQIVRTQSASPDPPVVPGGGHVLIVPIEHHSAFNTIPVDVAQLVIDETERYKSTLRAFYCAYGATAVTFEVGRAGIRGVHAHIQAVPVPMALADQVAHAFVNEGRKRGINFIDEVDADDMLAMCTRQRLAYLKVELPDRRRMVHVTEEGVPFNLQFGREVLANLLNMPERRDWKACVLSEDEDMADAQAFRDAYIHFDPHSNQKLVSDSTTVLNM